MRAAQLGQQLSLFGSCQRWRRGREAFRPAGEPFEPTRYCVEQIAFSTAKRFVLEHHYSGTMPAARLELGLLEKPSRWRREEVAGVIVLSVPVQERAIPAWFDGMHPRLGIEIGRLVLLDDVPGNGETWFLGRAFRLMRKLLPEVRGVLSYCDPLERRDGDGRVVKRGHIGTVYRAFNGRYVGRSSPRVITVSRDGRCVSERALSKIRGDEQGAAYAVRQLTEMGAPARDEGESGAAYVERALRTGGFSRVRHPGNLTFTWRVDGTQTRGPLNSHASPVA